jgi:hypothetical protein
VPALPEIPAAEHCSSNVKMHTHFGNLKFAKISQGKITRKEGGEGTRPAGQLLAHHRKAVSFDENWRC